jgi:acyl-CoA reductase-like NAD-dependent aldehyde dehydrogenase
MDTHEVNGRDNVARNQMSVAAFGMNIVAGQERAGGGEPFRAIDPVSGSYVGSDFHAATEKDIADAVDLAVQVYNNALLTPGITVPILNTVAHFLEDWAKVILETCTGETGLSIPRLESELARTSDQLRFLARIAERGERLDAVIDQGDPEGMYPELRKVRLPIGPIAVFGASNFPLAFSVLGGDTASALAAGCPVIMKAHPAHPATSELCGRLMANAVAKCGLEPGWFSLLQGNGSSVGTQLVQEEGIKAVAFTGSLQGGRALFDIASRRLNPIPVFAEMGSLNPVFLTKASIRNRGGQIAQELAQSISGSAGQLCTKPGLIFLPEGQEGDFLENDLANAFVARPAGHLLTQTIYDTLAAQFNQTSLIDGVDTLVQQTQTSNDPGLMIPGRLFRTTITNFRTHPELQSEHFGPSAIIVTCPESEFRTIPELLEGSLTGTIFFESDESELVSELLGELIHKVGRVIGNGVPMGVRVARGMSHGGPYPATTSVRDTSVGSAAIDRFLRPVTYQNIPNELLPLSLRDNNPLGIVRQINSHLTTDSIEI